MEERGDEVRQEAPSGGVTADETEASAQLRADLEEANSKAQEYLGLLQRTQADFSNYRKRVEQEREERARFATGEAILKLLPVLDDLERAIQAIPEDQRNLDWVQGIMLIERKFRNALELDNVTQIEALGKPFDPWEMEAVFHEEKPDVEPGTVVHVIRPGYRHFDRVIRPAQVVVAK